MFCAHRMNDMPMRGGGGGGGLRNPRGCSDNDTIKLRIVLLCTLGTVMQNPSSMEDQSTA